MALILLDEVLEDAYVIRVPLCSHIRCLSAQDGVHYGLQMLLLLLRGLGCVVRELSPKLSMALIVVSRVLQLLLLLLLLLLHVHLLFGRSSGAADDCIDSGLLGCGLKGCSPIELDGCEQVLQGLVLLVQEGTQVVVALGLLLGRDAGIGFARGTWRVVVGGRHCVVFAAHCKKNAIILS